MRALLFVFMVPPRSTYAGGGMYETHVHTYVKSLHIPEHIVQYTYIIYYLYAYVISAAVISA